MAWAAARGVAAAGVGGAPTRKFAPVRGACAGVGAADDEKVRAGASGFSWSGDARLIVCGDARGPHGGNQSQEFRAAGAANRGNLVRRGDDAVEARFFCE